MPDHVYRYPVVRPMDPRELREARRARLRASAVAVAVARTSAPGTAPVRAVARPR